MKRYLRLKSGKIIESKGFGIKVSAWNRRVAESDYIDDLIMAEDLVKIHGSIWCYEHVVDCVNFNRNDITQLYTKQGNDYILVARKTKNKWKLV